MTEIPEEVERRVQELYVGLLHKFCIISVLHSPIDVFEQLCIQQIKAVRTNPEELRMQISSCRLLKQQSATLLKTIMKTSYKELRRVELAVQNGIENDYQYVRKELRNNVACVFDGIALELKLEAGEAVNLGALFFPVIPCNNPDVERKLSCTSVPSRESESEYDPSSQPRTKTLQKQLFFVLVEFEQPEELQKFLADPAVNHKEVWVDKYDTTCLHDAAQNSSMNSPWAVEFITTVMKFVEGNEKFPWTAQEFMNYRREEDGCTALHYAVFFGSIQAVECLIDLGADIFIRDNDDETPQDYMYDWMPEALLYVLSRTAVTASFGNPQDKYVVVRLDFGAFVNRLNPNDYKRVNKTLRKGTTTNSQDANENPLIGDAYIPVQGDESESKEKNSVSVDDYESFVDLRPEMDNLAMAIYRFSKTAAPQLLSHIVVKIFLELKWIKLKWPIYLLTLFYIAVYISYTAFAVYVFIVKVPYAPDMDFTAAAADNGTAVSEAFNNEVTIHPVATVVLAIATGLYVGLEIWQYFLIRAVAKSSGLQALLYYLHDFENVLQLLFMVGAFSVTSVVYAGDPEAQDWSYWFAAFSIVIAWILILLQLGNFYGLGKYVYMFQTVFKRFATVMALYLCFLIGFTIAFSIIFPEDKFVSFPRSFFRTFAMMTGELNFDDVFDPEETRPFELAALAIYLSFTIIVTIVIVNLLVGLTVDDVAKIFKEADAIHRKIQVERLYILEHMLYRFCKDIFVVPRKRRVYGAVVDTEMRKFPRDLRQELRCLLADPVTYKKEYLEFDNV